jgi:hypothetical protein
MADEVIKEVRRIRLDISEVCGHEVSKVIAYYRQIERELRASGRYRFEETADKEVSDQSSESSPPSVPLTTQ